MGKCRSKTIVLFLALGLLAMMVGAAPALATTAPSVSIDPATQEVLAGDSFSIDVMVDAGSYDLRGCKVAVSYDSGVMATTEAQVTEHNLLGDLDIGPTVEAGEVSYALASTSAVSGVSGSAMTIEFTVSDAATATYDLTIMAEMRDENNEFVPGMVTNDGSVTILPLQTSTITATAGEGGTIEPSGEVIEDLSISPSEVNIGEEVTISVLVTNTGSASGSYRVTLKIDGPAGGYWEATKEVTLNAGASKEVTFTTAKDVALSTGSYSVTVNGLSGLFSVREKPAPLPLPAEEVPPEEAPPTEPAINWPVIGGIIAGVVIVGLLIFLVGRKAT